MSACPRCLRPVAVARPTCVYCGAELPPEAVAAAAESAKGVAQTSLLPNASPAPADRLGTEAIPEGPARDRHVLVLDLERLDPEVVAQALGLPLYEAGQRVKRGLQLHKLLDAPAAQAEAATLAAAGLPHYDLPEGEVREAGRPQVAVGGEWAQDALALRTEEGRVRVGVGDVLLVVKGPIVREYQTSREVKRVRTATLEGGYRIHLHGRHEVRPVELDPGAFAFGRDPAGAGSSLIQLSAWAEMLSAGAAVDQGFSRLPPALAPEAPPTGGAAAAVGAMARRPGRGEEAPAPVLDNLAQFRFYSAWRAAVERRRSKG